MNEEQPTIPVQVPPTQEVATSMDTVTPAVSQEMRAKNGVYVVSALGAFILLLAFAFLAFPKAQNDTPVAQELPVVPLEQYAPPPPYQPEIVESMPEPVDVPMYPSVAMSPGNLRFGVPLIPETIAYDLTRDGVITNDDVRIVADAIDQGHYFALVDFDSSGNVDTTDLSMIRATLQEYPIVSFDLTRDNMINSDDIAIVANIVDQGLYLALFDFDANGRVDVGDLSLIREGVVEAGTVGAGRN